MKLEGNQEKSYLFHQEGITGKAGWAKRQQKDPHSHCTDFLASQPSVSSYVEWAYCIELLWRLNETVCGKGSAWQTLKHSIKN